MGPIMMDVAGTHLDDEDKTLLADPRVGGLILFTRNYQNPAQLAALVEEAKAAARGPLLVAVDHEGGRVQRFREGFTRLPAMGNLLEKAQDKAQACAWATELGYLMAYELKQVGVDISFAPVLDTRGVSDVIGDRGFSAEPQDIGLMARAWCVGMKQAGMPTTGKHFPGHGGIKEDSHIAIGVDHRSLAQIQAHDLTPFHTLMKEGLLDAVMPAHVIFPQVDDKPAGFSEVWVKQILRAQMGFRGVAFSDDLGMQGASVAGSYLERVQASAAAGCDMFLVCNNRPGLLEVLDGFEWQAEDTRLREFFNQCRQPDWDHQRIEGAKRIAHEVNT